MGDPAARYPSAFLHRNDRFSFEAIARDLETEGGDVRTDNQTADIHNYY